MNLTEFRYNIEHILFPRYFFENPFAFFAALFGNEDETDDGKANYLFEIIEDLSNKCDFELPYTADQYNITMHMLAEDECLCVITIPKPEEPLLCSHIYLRFADDVSKNRYFTVELMESKLFQNKYCLCEHTVDNRINYGFISNKTKQHIEKIIHILNR